MAIEILRGEQALRDATEPALVRLWSDLSDRCPWVTVFQSPAFVNPWYEVYASEYEPLLVFEQAEKGLTGMLPLAISRRSGRCVVAGAHQAEYHGWLSELEEGGAFFLRALAAIDAVVASPKLTFLYLPPRFPASELLGRGALRARLTVEPHTRPIVQLERLSGTPLLGKTLAKRLRKLEQERGLRFERVTDRADYQAAFAAAIPMYDLRQGAVNRSLPFTGDPLKQRFHDRLFDEGLLHVTVLRSGDGEPLSVHANLISHHEVHLAVTAYSPFFADYSPGRAHIGHLGGLLAEEGFHVLDLTPGGDRWKESFATASEPCYRCNVYRSSGARKAASIAGVTRGITRRMARSQRPIASVARGIQHGVNHASPHALLRAIRRRLKPHSELRVYRYDFGTKQPPKEGGGLMKNALTDLLKYAGTDEEAKFRFLSDALSRLESGEHVFTAADDNRLLHYGWLIPRQARAFFSEVRKPFDYPPGSAVLYDFFTHPEARGKRLYQRNLMQMLRECRGAGARYAYITVLADNGPSRHVIEKLGFEYQQSLHSTRAGRRHPAQAPAE